MFFSLFHVLLTYKYIEELPSFHKKYFQSSVKKYQIDLNMVCLVFFPKNLVVPFLAHLMLFIDGVKPL